MEIRTFDTHDLRCALADGWAIAHRTRYVSSLYAALFVLAGAAILATLLLQGFTPFIIAAAGAFMLIGPVILAGFFGIARADEQGRSANLGSLMAGFTEASSAIWVIALVCALLFMIFVTDAAILYSYMVGRTPVWLSGIDLTHTGVRTFLVWGMISGLAIAGMLFCVAAFSIPLLCEHRAHLVQAVVASVRATFGNPLPMLVWALLLATLTMGSILLLPLLLLTLPWLAHSSYALYRRVFPQPA